MKNRKLLGFAVVLGAVAVFLVNSKLGDLEAKANPPSTMLYRATVNIEPAAGLTLEAAVKQQLLEPVKNVPLSLLKSLRDAVDSDIFETWKREQIARTIRAGDWLRTEHLARLSTTEVSARLRADPSDPRGGGSDVALGLTVNAETAVGFLVSPGDRVDVWSTRMIRDATLGEGQRASARKVGQNLRVFAVDSLVLPTPDERGAVRFRGQSYRTVSLRVPEDQLAVILEARAYGPLTMVLRPSDGK